MRLMTASADLKQRMRMSGSPKFGPRTAKQPPDDENGATRRLRVGLSSGDPRPLLLHVRVLKAPLEADLLLRRRAGGRRLVKCAPWCTKVSGQSDPLRYERVCEIIPCCAGASLCR